MLKPSIIAENLKIKMQETTVIDGISFSLMPCEHLAISGNSGSGKTALAMALAGKIYYNGKILIQYGNTVHSQIEIAEQRYTFKNLSGINDFYYQQRFNSFDACDAPTVIEELLKCFKENNSGEKKIDSILHVLNTLEIEYVKDSPLIQLSNGEHKRFQLARALLKSPQLLILDTPYTGLDVSSVKKLNLLLKKLAEKGTQIILLPGTFPTPEFISHVAFLENKKLSFFGNKENFISTESEFIHEPVITFDPVLFPAEENKELPETIVEMKDTSMKYGDHVIFKHLNWKVMKSERWLLKGRNGSGKSSLLGLITGDHPQAYSNGIYLFGRKRGSGESIWDIKKKTGYISPELHAYFDKNMTCYQAIGSGYFDTIGLFRKLSEKQLSNVLQWMDFLRLSHVSKKPLHSLSSSLQRLILLARALVKNPPLLVLDEPCQGLDNEQSILFTSLIDQICNQSTKTLIYVSHDERNIPSCVQKVLHLDQGAYKIYSLNQNPLLAVA